MVNPEVPLSILDLAVVGRDDTVADALAATVEVARAAEERGYRRVWYAEHHNMSSIASSATSVLLAHVAAHTRHIRLGSGGIMLPNHAPLTIAEQFGTLATLHPGRIELGVGRAPGTDQRTVRALRRSPAAADRFPEDVLELQAYLAGESIVEGVRAIPGAGTDVPITILGSSLYGAQLAAALGLPYGFASHFAPEALQDAVAVYRATYRPSARHPEPYVHAGVNVVVADTHDEALELFERVKRSRVASFLGRGLGRRLTDDEVEHLVHSPQGLQIIGMMRHTAVGTPAEVRSQLGAFARTADADDLIVVHNAPTVETRLRSVHLLADAYEVAPRASGASTSSPKAASVSAGAKSVNHV
ncbi:MAG: LLM class flavin-dependent oxidoreductase [Acidimicrobiales bacterium]|jgi:luciferase family oxidoreductase group 1|nr:LLM class flavin-dependent oxidoreductase [Acidimicrobiales bacterium]